VRGRRFAACLAVGVGLLTVLTATPASAHPLGNFTVNQHSGLVVSPGRVTVELVVDMAEIPTFQARSEIDTDADKTVAPIEADAYRQRACAELAQGVELRLDDQPLAATVASAELTFPPGEAGLATLRLTCRLSAPVGRDTGRLDFANRNFTKRIGWREITATGNGVRLAATDVPPSSSSAVLTHYPDDLLSSPLDQRQAHLRLDAAGEAPQAQTAPAADDTVLAAARPSASGARGTDRFTAAFTGLVARQRFTLGFGLLALVAAIALGALHALAPGHGKTVMAAYLVGERGSVRQAALLGLTVTSTHTAGVLLLGVLLSGSTAVVPEKLYPWLGVTSGVMLAGVGVSLLVRAWRRRADGLAAFAAHRHDGDHHHGPGHHHHGHHHHGAGSHDHGRPGHADAHSGKPAMSRRALVIMGAAGGMTPSPSALVVLLGAIALGRTWFGIALVFGYGVGMALTLVAAGLLMVRARATLDRRLRGRTRMARLAQTLPVMTASFVVIAGVGLAARALHQI
jgi:nickel/cobalt transporter (NicO) family protein